MNRVQGSMFGGRVIVWFSCGVASATAAKLAMDKYGESVHVVYCDTSRDEHPENITFLRLVEQWIGKTITIIKSEKYNSIEDVFATGYMSGPQGAKCTVEMKKIPRFAFQWPDDTHILGLCADFRRRISQFEEDNFDMRLDWILRDNALSKQDCIDFVERAGLPLPTMYRLGYENNNCLGCVKATSPHYWNRIRKDFPDVFTRRATQSRQIGCRLVRYKGERIYLDELPFDSTERVEESLSCGIQCSSSHAE